MRKEKDAKETFLFSVAKGVELCWILDVENGYFLLPPMLDCFFSGQGDFHSEEIGLVVGAPNSKQVSHMGEQLAVVCKCWLFFSAWIV